MPSARILSLALRPHGRVARVSWAAESKQRKGKQRSAWALMFRGLCEESGYYFPQEFVQNLIILVCLQIICSTGAVAQLKF